MISRAGRIAFAACAIPTLAQAAGIPQTARTGDAADSDFGVTIKDPYRWMEAQGPDFLAWADRQNRVTRSTLDALPGYVPLAHEVAKAGDAVTAVAWPQRRGAMLYFERRAPGEDQPSLYVRPLAGGAPRKLVDPVTFGGTTMAISEYEVSPDNRRLAFTLSSGGSEEAVMHLMDIGTRTLMPETIDRARLADPRWAPDGSVVFYTRLKEKFSGPGRPLRRPGHLPPHPRRGPVKGRAGVHGRRVRGPAPRPSSASSRRQAHATPLPSPIAASRGRPSGSRPPSPASCQAASRPGRGSRAWPTRWS